jgi:hypothetical protein
MGRFIGSAPPNPNSLTRAMNPQYLTKIAKHTLIGSISAYLSFAGKNNPSVRLFFVYSIAGIITVFVVAMLWEARDYLIAQQPTEDQLSTLIGGLTNSKPETRKYFLPAKVRLEIVVALTVIVVCGLIGNI